MTTKIRKSGTRVIGHPIRAGGGATTVVPTSTVPTNSRRHPAPPPLRTSGEIDVCAVVVTRRSQLAWYVAHKLGWQTLRPARVVVCTEVADYDLSPLLAALPESQIDLVVDTEHRVLGALRNFAMDEAAARSGDGTILCSIDDDDFYGADYTAGIVDAWRRHPDAMIIGRASWAWKVVVAPPTSPLPNNIWVRRGPTKGVAGATISVPAKLWRSRPDFRYPELGCGEDIALLAKAAAEGGVVSAYFGEFTALRYESPEHGHTSPAPTLQQNVPTGRRR